MSRNSLDGKDDFDEQLRLQQLYGNTQKGPGRENSFGQQPDDTPYEWDLDKKAWFPKVSVSPVPLQSRPLIFFSRSWGRAPISGGLSFCSVVAEPVRKGTKIVREMSYI